MILSSTSPLNSLLAQILGGPKRTGSAASAVPSTVLPQPGAAPSTGLKSAVAEALQQIGLGGSAQSSSATSTGASSTSSAQSSQSALDSFVQSLYAALQPSSGSGIPLAGHRRHAEHGGGAMEKRLQSLIQQLQAPGGTGSAAGPSASSSSPLGTLQQSFNTLVSALGSPAGSSAGFGAFLNTLATDLASQPATGNLVSTQA